MNVKKNTPSEKMKLIKIPESLAKEILEVTGYKPESLTKAIRKILREGVEVERRIKTTEIKSSINFYTPPILCK